MLKILGGENIEFLSGGIFTQIQLHFLLRLEIQKLTKRKAVEKISIHYLMANRFYDFRT